MGTFNDQVTMHSRVNTECLVIVMSRLLLALSVQQSFDQDGICAHLSLQEVSFCHSAQLRIMFCRYHDIVTSSSALFHDCDSPTLVTFLTALLVLAL